MMVREVLFEYGITAGWEPDHKRVTSVVHRSEEAEGDTYTCDHGITVTSEYCGLCEQE
jgi:hypothetical protein